MERNLQLEQSRIPIFKQKYGQDPDIYHDPKQRAQFYALSYPTETDLPDELKGTVDYSLLSAGLPSRTTGQQTDLERLKGGVETAKAGVDEFKSPTSATDILRQAIRAKVGYDKEELGQSDIYKEAGLTGMSTLIQSMNARSDELNTNLVNFRGIVDSMAGIYSDQANMAMWEYENAVDAYNKEKDYLAKIEEETRQYERTINLYKEKSEIDKELAAYKESVKRFAPRGSSSAAKPFGFSSSQKTDLIGGGITNEEMSAIETNLAGGYSLPEILEASDFSASEKDIIQRTFTGEKETAPQYLTEDYVRKMLEEILPLEEFDTWGWQSKKTKKERQKKAIDKALEEDMAEIEKLRGAGLTDLKIEDRLYPEE